MTGHQHPITRLRGSIVGKDDGPTLVVVAGIHGNEPAGLEAADRVLARLHEGHERRLHIRGEFVVVAGHVAGLNRGVRYVNRDLNRGWTEAAVARLQAADAADLAGEDLEQRQLVDTLDAIVGRARGPVILADCHTSSAPGVPFVLYGSTPAQREFVSVFPIPVISGIVEKVEGVLSEFIAARGPLAFSVEGGQHESAASRDSLEAILWLCLQQAGMLDADEVPEVRFAGKLLEHMRGDLPRMVDVVSRHAITAEDHFTMERGFRCVDRIDKGQLLARDKNGELRAEEDGVVVLPLYQALGSDGFFWGREVR